MIYRNSEADFIFHDQGEAAVNFKWRQIPRTIENSQRSNFAPRHMVIFLIKSLTGPDGDIKTTVRSCP